MVGIMSYSDKIFHETDINVAINNHKTKHGKKEEALIVTNTILETLDALEFGESCYLTTQGLSKPCLSLEVDWYRIRTAVTANRHLEWVSVTKTPNNVAEVVLQWTPDTIKYNVPENWAKFKLRRAVCHGELKMSSRYFVSTNRRSITIFHASFEALIKDLQDNLDLFSHEWHREDQFDLNTITKTDEAFASYTNNEHNARVAPKEGPDEPINTSELILTKSQVTYLIGKRGERIESIREQSEATIKILPIPERLSSLELCHPNSVFQSIAVTGNLYQVATALATIESHLSLHRLCPKQLL